jgi:hypothetical protein
MGTRRRGFRDVPVAVLEMKNEAGEYVAVADVELRFDFGAEVAEVAAAAVAKHFQQKEVSSEAGKG